MLLPRHRIFQLLLSAQVDIKLAAIDTMPVNPQVTAVGMSLFPVVPSPSCPALLNPRHRTVPSCFKAQECDTQTAICVIPVSEPVTAVGTNLSPVVPSQSCPLLFLPRHRTVPSSFKIQVDTGCSAKLLTPVRLLTRPVVLTLTGLS